ncbi:MAG: GNAT family N-acetyltransferase [Kiloniellaceae bacterium]
MTTKVRRAVPGDAEAIIGLINALSAFVEDPPTRLTAEDIRRDGFGPDAWFDCFVVDQNGKLSGYAITYPGFSTDHGGRGLHLADLYVDPSLRGIGWGGALMLAVARDALARGALWVMWDVWVKNHSAEAFYKAVGGERYDDVFIMTLKGAALAQLARENP